MNTAYIYLAFAILCETIGTTFMKSSDGFTKLGPSAGTFIGFSGAIYLMSLSLKTLPVGIVYAVWSGLGIVLITLIGLFYFKQQLDFAAYFGISLILIGVIILFGFSDAKA